MSNFVSELRQKNKKRGWQLFALVFVLQLITVLVALSMQSI
jgi:hypothetical protein